MKSRESLVRLKEFQVNEKRRQLQQLQMMMGEFDRMTKDLDEQEDLMQEALIALWKADPTRYDVHDGRDMGYLRRIMVNRMKRVYGRGLENYDEMMAALRRELAPCEPMEDET